MKFLTARTRPAKTKRPGSIPLRGLGPIAVGLLIWQLLGSADSAYFPVPTEWWAGLVKLWEAGKLLPGIRVTVIAFAWALILSVIIGSVIGAAIGRSELLDRLLGPMLEIGRTMPAGAMVPVMVLIMGYTSSMKLTVVVFTSMWPILLSARAGAKQITSERVDTARVFHVSRVQTFFKVTLPSLVPSITLGTQIAAPIALIIVLLVEILTQVSGIGREIALAQSTFKAGTVYGLVAIAGVLGLAVNWLIGWLEFIIRRFDPNSTV